MILLAAIWDWITKSRYVVHLEAENERLRQENRELVNSLLSGMGLPQVGNRVTSPMKPKQGKPMPSQLREMFERQDRATVEKEAV